MRAPAAVITIPLVIGCCCGLLMGAESTRLLAMLAAASGLMVLLAACVACALGDAGECTTYVVIGALTAGVSLGLTAATRAYAPPLPKWYAAPGARASSPVVLAGGLRSDAAPTPIGASLVVDVDAIGACGGTAGAAIVEDCS